MPDFTPANPDYEALIRKTFARQSFMRLIGAEPGAIAPGLVELRVPFRDDLCQHDGVFHGGVIGTLADNAAGAAAGTLSPAGANVLTVEYKINFMAPGRGEALLARAQVVRPGRTLTVCRADVYTIESGTETPCAGALVTLMILPPR